MTDHRDPRIREAITGLALASRRAPTFDEISEAQSPPTPVRGRRAWVVAVATAAAVLVVIGGGSLLLGGSERASEPMAPIEGNLPPDTADADQLLDRVIEVTFDGDQCVVTGPDVVPLGFQPVLFHNKSEMSDVSFWVSFGGSYGPDHGPGLMLADLKAMQEEAGGVLWVDPEWWGEDGELVDTRYAYVLMLGEEQWFTWSRDPNWHALLADQIQPPDRRLKVYDLTRSPSRYVIYLGLFNERFIDNSGFWFCDEFATEEVP